ncbi:zinc-binding dehydrogenase [Saccharicrinis sp. FJH54]|uniref:zinc-dependent alcohol dehydrogenase n=1 Tax=Saccharicrinis sp. FJH54 TaxID=3344665 RepID=UPI0035D4CDDC
MKAVALTNIKTLEVVEIPEINDPANGEVLIKVKSVGVCGSDMHYYRTGRIGSQVVAYPFVLGHEFAGEIVKAGGGVTNVRPGSRVAVDPAMSCGECDQCRAGREHTCRNLTFLGNPGQADGCMKEYIIMPANTCFELPDNLSFDDGMLCEPFSIGIYAVKSFGNVSRLDIGILGFGPIGMSVLSALKPNKPSSVIVSEKLDYRLRIASGFGADMAVNPLKEDLVAKVNEGYKNQLDVVFECCGQQDAVHQAIEMLKPGGTLMIVGIPEFDVWHLPVDQLRRKEITIKNVRRQNHCMQDAIDMLTEVSSDLKQMITHRVDYTKSQEVYDLVEAYEDNVMKAVVTF